MTRAQATSELAFAITQRDLAGVRDALARGADPDVAIHQNRGLPPLRAAEWVVSRFYPMDYLRALLDGGVRLDERFGGKQLTSLLGVSLRAGNDVAARLLVKDASVGQVEWNAVAQSCNPEMAAQILLQASSGVKLDAKHPAAGLCVGPHAMRFVRVLHGKGMQWAGVVANKTFSARIHDQLDVFLEVVRLAHRQDPEALRLAIRKSGTTPLHQAGMSADFPRLLQDPVVAAWRETVDNRGLTPLAAQIKQGNMVGALALLDAGCLPPAMQEGEDRAAYAARLLGKRFSGMANHQALDRAWAHAQAIALDASGEITHRSSQRMRL